MSRVGRMVAGGIVAAVLAGCATSPGHPDQRHRADPDGRDAIGRDAIGRTVVGDLASARPGGGRLGCRR